MGERYILLANHASMFDIMAIMAIFPEGTRTLDGKLNSFYRGFIHLLRTTEHDILPVTLSRFYKLKPKNRFSIHMDVGQVNELHFLNGMGLGFDAQVAAENYVEPGKGAKASSKGKYIWHIVKTLLFYKEGKVTVTSRDKQQESDCFINTISVGRRFAGSFFLTPEAIVNDRLLNVCMIRKLNLLQRFKILSMVPKGTHVKDKKVDYYQTEKINVDFGKKVPFHLDGELYFDTHFKVSLLPSALNIIYNPVGKHFFNE